MLIITGSNITAISWSDFKSLKYWLTVVQENINYKSNCKDTKDQNIFIMERVNIISEY